MAAESCLSSDPPFVRESAARPSAGNTGPRLRQELSILALLLPSPSAHVGPLGGNRQDEPER